MKKLLHIFVPIIMTIFISSPFLSAQTKPTQSWPTGGVEVWGTSVQLTWYGQAYTDEVELQVSQNSDFSSPIVNTSLAAATYIYTLSPLTAGTTYYWRVRAKVGASTSDWASTSFFTHSSSSSSFTITASAGSGGAISPSGAVSVASGGSQTFTITANSGYSIYDVKVDGNTVGAVSSYTFTNVTANHTIAATFSVSGGGASYTITASAGANGSITPTGAVTVNSGDNQIFVMTPSTGYVVNDVLVDNVSVGNVASYIFSNVTSDHTISVSFKQGYIIYVATTGSDATGDGTTAKPYKTIQKGIDNASTGYTVSVAAGTYIENISITKGITLQGTGYNGTTTITPSNNSSNTIEITWSGSSSTQLIIDGFDIQPPSSSSYYPVKVNANSNYITIRNSKITTYNETSTTHKGIYFADGSHKNITLGGTSSSQGNVFLFYEDDIAVDFDLSVSITPSLYISVLNNTFTASNTGHQAMKFGAVQILTMTGNTFGSIVTFNVTNNTSTQISIGGNGSGLGNIFSPTNPSIDATAGLKFADLGTGNLSDVTITQNNFTNATTAINIDVDLADIDEATISITKNRFSGNTTAIKTNAKAYSPNISAANNYWNNTNGPTNSANLFNSTHGEVVGDSVTFLPFYQSISGSPGTYNGTSFAPVTNNESPVEYYASISAAITGTSAGKKITVAAGTFTEDLTIDKQLELVGAGSGLTTIKGEDDDAVDVAISGNNVKIHGFTFESEDQTTGLGAFTQISIASTSGSNAELYNNIFKTVGSSNSALGTDYTTVIAGIADISGLYIHDNTFTFSDLIPIGTGTYGYNGINISTLTALSDSIIIKNNTMSGNLIGGILLDDVNFTTGIAYIYNNTLSTSTSSSSGFGISIADAAEKVTISNNTITDFSNGNGIDIQTTESGISITGNTLNGNSKGVYLNPTYINDQAQTDITINGSNLIYDNNIGIDIDATFVAVQSANDVILINDNSIYSNTTSGLDVSGVTTLTSNYTYLNAENNWWGDTDGPSDATYYDTNPNTGTKSELPANSTDPVEQYVNENPSGSLGNSVVDNSTADAGSGGFFVDYYPWYSSPKIEINDVSTVTGATVTIPVTLKMFNNTGFNSLEGKFTYTSTKLEFQSATFGSGTLINTNGWIITFFDKEATSTTHEINFAAVGSSAITSDGTLFNLLMKVIDPITSGSSTTDITGTTTDFKADGSNTYFDEVKTGTVSYDFQQSTYKRGDADLDGDVDLNDAIAISNYLSSTLSLSSTAIQNADADLSGGGSTATASDITTSDISAILYNILHGSWPPTTSSAAAVVTFSNVSVSPDNLLHLPISLNGSVNVSGLEMELNYDPNNVDYQTFKDGMAAGGNIVDVIKVKDGTVKFVFASANLLNGNLTPGEVVLNFPNGIPNSSTIKTKYSLNGGELKEGPQYTIGTVTGIEDENVIPNKFTLEQNYPNPFNPSTNIRFALPNASFVTLKIYNMLGQEVKTLVNEQKNAGIFDVQWNGDNNFGQKVASGIYIYRVIAGKNMFSKKMILLK